MSTQFFFGTLRHLPVLQAVLGAAAMPQLTPAWLPGYAAHWVAGQTYPMLLAQPGARAEGVLATGLSAEACARLAFYEGGHGYGLQPHQVRTDAGVMPAQVWFPDPVPAPGAAFDLADWQARFGEVTALAAQEVMGLMGQADAAAVARRYPSILARAAAALNARHSAPTSLRRRAEPGDVQVHGTRQAYANFFSVQEYQLSHTRFDGSRSAELDRAAFVSTDAVTVLPYDARRDRVLLIEQFRMGPFARGDAQCWSLEAIAGRIEPGEPVQDTARREALEEAGLQIGALHPIASYYSSPGAKTEYIYAFAALCDLPDDAAGLGGLLSEGEDIRAHVVSFERAMELVQSGEVENAPLILSLQWLAANRDRLRGHA